VKYLLDTSVWLRSSLHGQSIPKNIKPLLEDPNEILGLSIFSVWEAAKKHQKGRLLLPAELSAWLENALPDQISILPLTKSIIIDSTRLPDFPVNDPADEMIVATARVHGLILLTTDTKLKNYSHAKIRYFSPVDRTV
jgi:PIN domain nuclease of toxin-antitoxin system